MEQQERTTRGEADMNSIAPQKRVFISDPQPASKCTPNMLPTAASLAAAVERDFTYFAGTDFRVLAKWCTTLLHTGVVMAWILVNAKSISDVQKNLRFFNTVYVSGMQHRAGSKKSALPLRAGECSKLFTLLKGATLQCITSDAFLQTWGRLCWVFVSCYSCNAMFGETVPLTEGGWTKCEMRAVKAIGSSVERVLCHGHVTVPYDSEMEKELKHRRVNYQGEEVGVCHPLTLDQVLPSLPPKEHGGAIDATAFVTTHTKDLLMNPNKSILPDVGQDLPKLQGRIHGDKSEIKLIAHELVERNVCSWIPYESVVEYRGQKVLNGLFGVKKSAVLPDQRPVLRLIMNLVPSNSIMRGFTGAVKNLPSITSWMSTVMEGETELRVWQSDMSNAFYLFRIPDSWRYFLAFNVVREPDELEKQQGISGKLVLACNVLPMGWISSVAIMQEISEKILHYRGVDSTSQIVRNRPVPPWLTGIARQARETSRFWWHVYLDNFASAQAYDAELELGNGEALHQLAELAWKEAGVVSSAKKRRKAVGTAEELGAFIDGQQKFIGGSPERFIKLAQATLWTIGQPILSKKLVQVIAGRWIHVMQFRRPCMGFLDLTWDFISSKRFGQTLHQGVRRELFNCVSAMALMHTFLGASVSGTMTASDASSTGGAVGIAKELTAEGQDYVRCLDANQYLQGDIPVLVISLFGGIGGAFRTYDILGLRPMGLVHFDTHEPANRITSRRWPHAEIFLDVRKFTRETIRDLLARYLGIVEIHFWAGFPCVDLSSANATGQGLKGPASSLFFEVLRIRRIILEEIGAHIVLKMVVENVASMKATECQEISHHLGLQPYFLDCADAVPMHRPRLCWTTEYLENCMDEKYVEHQQRWRRVYAEAPYPETQSWVEPGVEWSGATQGVILPTSMKAIVRKAPPVQPAGIDKCDAATLERYAADSFRYPPYQYASKYLFWTTRGTWRLINAEEKELLMGYGWKHTSLCYSASKIKASYQRYDDERHSLLGDSFSIFSFIIPAYCLCKNFLPRVKYKHLAARMGLAPGFRNLIRTEVPLCRRLSYGHVGFADNKKVHDLNRYLLTRTNHTGSDIRISTGEILNPKAHPRQGVEAAWWHWLPSFRVHWKIQEHINKLELRSILLAIQYRVNHHHETNMRIFHISDSYVCLSMIGKGRTGSKQLTPVLRKLNAVLLAHGLTIIIGHVESTMNPTDGASRSLATT